MNSHSVLFIILIMIGCLSGAASDIYAPSLSTIANALHTPITQAQFSLTIFMVGLAFSQLIYGPISEGFGRRKPLIVGLLIFICASLMCFLATRIELLILGRLIQGLGAGACASLWRSIFRDMYQGDDLAKYGAYLAIVITFVVPAVPTLGGYLQHYLGWQGSFAFLLVYSVLALLLILYVFKETSKNHHPDQLSRQFITQAFRQLLTSRIFMGYTIAVFFCYGAFFSWFAVGPVLLIQKIGLSPVEFGWLSFVIGAGAMSSAGAVNGRMVKRVGMLFMLRLGWGLMFIAGCLLLFGQVLFGVNIYAITIPVFLFYFGVTFIWPNAFAGAFTPFGHIAGYAGSLYSFMQLGGGAVIANITAHLSADTALPLAIIFILSPICAWLSYEIMVQRLHYRYAQEAPLNKS